MRSVSELSTLSGTSWITSLIRASGENEAIGYLLFAIGDHHSYGLRSCAGSPDSQETGAATTWCETTARVSHHGPDGEGFWTGDPGFLRAPASLDC